MRYRSSGNWRAGLTALALVLPTAALAGNGVYLHVDLGYGWSGGTHFEDADCAQTNPPALFGCQTGNDGEPIGARGDFGNAVTGDLGVGYRFSRWVCAEVLLSYRPNLGFSGNANFLGVSGGQPVSGSLKSVAVFAVAYVDFPAFGRWQPFLDIGAGAARNRLGPVTYGFPDLGAGAITRTGGGADTDFAWLVGVGVSFALAESLSLDLAYRYSDLGQAVTASGPALIVRGSGSRTLDVGATQARLTMQEILFGLHYSF